MGKVTMTRGNDLSDIHRNRHHTDDSSIGSYKYEVNRAYLTFSFFVCFSYECFVIISLY